jgi:hypothetical protein
MLPKGWEREDDPEMETLVARLHRVRAQWSASQGQDPGHDLDAAAALLDRTRPTPNIEWKYEAILERLRNCALDARLRPARRQACRDQARALLAEGRGLWPGNPAFDLFEGILEGGPGARSRMEDAVRRNPSLRRDLDLAGNGPA